MLRNTLLYLSNQPRVFGFVRTNSIARRFASRFVAGETLDTAVAAVRALNSRGITASLDLLGESVTNEAEARATGATYIRILDRIRQDGLDANVSVKLTALGLDISEELCVSVMQSMLERAREYGNFVRIDMEDSSLTQVTLDIVRRIHALPKMRGAIGTVIQAYLYRSEADIQQLVDDGIRIRLCKGAYKEPATVAFPKKPDVDGNYVKLTGMLLSSPVYHGIATHDVNMIAAAKAYAREHSIDASRYEFQMLYGVRRDLQRDLVREGYGMRVYVPFGREWYPYFMRRLAERPANVFFLAKNMLRS